MKPRLDLIHSRFIRPKDEAFELDIAVYKNAYEAEEYLKEDVHETFKYPFSRLLFIPRNKVCYVLYLLVSLILKAQ